MHKMIELISNFLYQKPMLPFMQLHVHWTLIWWKINHMKIPKSWNFETKGYKGRDSFIKSFD